MGRVKKIAAPMNFGLENKNAPNHLNVSLLASNQGIVKANSLVLSYNSKTLNQFLGSKEVFNEVDVREFPKYVVDKFVDTLYTGDIDFERIPYTRQIFALADGFRVKWLLKKFDSYLVSLIDELVEKPRFSQVRYIFEQAYYLKTRKRRFRYHSMATRKLNSLRNKVRVKRNFLKRYISRDITLSTNQINLVIDFAGRDDCDVLLNVVLQKVKRGNYHTMDISSRRIIRQINLPQCLRKDMITFITIFGNKTRFQNLSHEDVEELRQLQRNSTITVFNERPDLKLDYKTKFRQLYAKREIPFICRFIPAARNTSRLELNNPLRIVNQILSERPATVVTIGAPRLRPDLIFGDDLDGGPDDSTLQEFLRETERIPNVTFSYPEALVSFQRTLQTSSSTRGALPWSSAMGYRLQDALMFFMESNFSFRNMYMFIEYIFIRKDFFLSPDNLIEADVTQYVEQFVAIKARHNWKKINSSFVSNILYKLLNGSMKNLLKMIQANSDLTSSAADSSDIAVEIVCARGVGSIARSRRDYDYNTIRMGEFIWGDIKRYKFRWKHPDTADCSLPGTCGFVLCVVPIMNSFEIRLSTRPEDYTGEIHCHPELLDASNMHLVLRRDFSTKGKSVFQGRREQYLHISWQDRPIFANNHVFWCGESIPDNGYIALIVYYSFTRKGEVENLEPVPGPSQLDQLDEDLELMDTDFQW